MKFSLSKEYLINFFSYLLLKTLPFLKIYIIKIVKKNKIVDFYIKYPYSFIDRVILRIFWGYYSHIANTKLARNLYYQICIDGSYQGTDFAEFYYRQNNVFANYNKSWSITNIPFSQVWPSFDVASNIIKKQIKNQPSRDTYLIQIGSCSGRDIEYLNFLNPEINFISTDISDEILEFQKTKYNLKNVKYFKCFGEDVNACIEHFGIENKSLIIFSNGSIHHITPQNIYLFFEKLSKYSDVNIISCQTANKYFIKNGNQKDLYQVSKNFLFTYRYGLIAKKYGFNIIEDRIIDVWKGSKYPNKATARHFLVANIKNN